MSAPTSEPVRKQSAPLSTQAYRGTRDFYPEEQRLRHFLFETMHRVLQTFGYEEYDGPFLEPLELYASKTSEEIVRDQLYSLTDRGERKLAIRPEMTPTLARMVSAKFHELPRPIRWYSIPTCMRYERPQRGRLREFAQLNVDVFGGTALDEDIEIILTAVRLLEKLGATSDIYEVKLNHRGLLNDLFAKLKIEHDKGNELLRLLDKRDKISDEVFKSECTKLGLEQRHVEELESFLRCELDDLPKIFGEGNPHVEAITTRVNALKQIVKGDAVRFCPDIMRGFDYYTGLVFEIFDRSPENRRALFGGGRYDNLVAAFGVPPLAGIGYGVSDVSLANFLEVHKLVPPTGKQVDVSVLRFSENDRLPALELCEDLRRQGLRVEAPLTAARFGKQIQSAEKSGARAVAFRGEDEMKNNTFAVKWLQTGEQQTYPLSAVADFANTLREKG